MTLTLKGKVRKATYLLGIDSLTLPGQLSIANEKRIDIFLFPTLILPTEGFGT